MDYPLSPEQVEVRDMIRRVAAERVAPRASEIDRTAEYPQDMFELLRELGLFALPFPTEYGGTGSLLSACLAVEEFGRVCYNTGYLLVVQWSSFGAILAGATDAQKARWLPGLASGALRGALSLTEPGTGSDVSGIKTTARRTANGYNLRGTKIWCTNASVADFILLAARTVNEAGEAGGINMFFVERDAPRLTIGSPEEKMGARGVPSCPIYLDGVDVPHEARLGPEGDKGFKIAMEALNASRPIVAARAVGLAQGAIDHAIAFVTERMAFGQRVSEFQGMRWMLADMVMKTEAARQLVYSAAARADAGVSGRELAPFSAMAKCFASDVAMEVATNAVQMCGATGISTKHPINRYFRDAKVVQIVEGTNQIQRNIIADCMLGPLPRRGAKS